MSALNIDYISEDVQPVRADGMIAIHFSGFDRETGLPQSSGYLFSEVELSDESFMKRYRDKIIKSYGPKTDQ